MRLREREVDLAQAARGVVARVDLDVPRALVLDGRDRQPQAIGALRGVRDAIPVRDRVGADEARRDEEDGGQAVAREHLARLQVVGVAVVERDAQGRLAQLHAPLHQVDQLRARQHADALLEEGELPVELLEGRGDDAVVERVEVADAVVGEPEHAGLPQRAAQRAQDGSPQRAGEQLSLPPQERHRRSRQGSSHGPSVEAARSAATT
jgi:hypothetical protein